MMKLNTDRYYQGFLSLMMGIGVAVILTGCDTVITKEYEATALTTYTWQVEYSLSPAGDKTPRRERFASTSLINRNGLKPPEAVLQDEQGLWWPALPPRPTVDEIEQRRQFPSERATPPELLKQVDYTLSYQTNQKTVTLPTNDSVYRQALKASSSKTPLQLTLGLNNASIEKAQPISSTE
jgi:hypothetical protein